MPKYKYLIQAVLLSLFDELYIIQHIQTTRTTFFEAHIFDCFETSGELQFY